MTISVAPAPATAPPELCAALTSSLDAARVALVEERLVDAALAMDLARDACAALESAGQPLPAAIFNLAVRLQAACGRAAEVAARRLTVALGRAGVARRAQRSYDDEATES